MKIRLRCVHQSAKMPEWCNDEIKNQKKYIDENTHIILRKNNAIQCYFYPYHFWYSNYPLKYNL